MNSFVKNNESFTEFKKIDSYISENNREDKKKFNETFEDINNIMKEYKATGTATSRFNLIFIENLMDCY